MTRFLILILITVCLQPALAQQAGDQRAFVKGTRLATQNTSEAGFYFGLTRDNGITYRTQARATDSLRLAGRLVPEPQHVGSVGDVFVLLLLEGTPYMFTSDERIVVWSGEAGELQPLLDDVPLLSNLEFDVFSGVVGAAVEFPVYLAYRESVSGEFNYTAAPITIALTNEKAPVESVNCQAFGNRTVSTGYRSAEGVFTHAPFRAEDLTMITNGIETNDPRFAYTWIKNRGEAIDIFAPADGVLVRMRHKVENLPVFPSDDFDLFFLVGCNPESSSASDIMFRFNHITAPRPDIRAAYAFGTLGAPTFNPEFEEHEERQVPTVNIAVKAGDYIGSTSGNPGAFGFDFQIGINDATVCPFAVLEEPHRSQLLALMGPQSNTPFGPPVPGFACTGYGARP